MKRTPERHTAKISDSFKRKLDVYSLAAAATGVGLAALAMPAQGEVVFTPAHQEIGRKGVFIDLNHDGVQDFQIVFAVFARADSAGVLVSSLAGNRVLSGTSANGRPGWVANLPAGYRVGPNSAKFKAGGSFSSIWGPAKVLFDCVDNSGIETCFGPWYKTQNSYVGFQFSIKGETHYGWARLKQDVLSAYEIHTYLTGYAYETIANKPIVTGKTSGSVEGNTEESETSGNATRSSATLGMLSAGTAALPMWRASEE
jgi:hypothetical protein